MTNSENTTSSIYEATKEFIEKYYPDELIFFDDFWKIYEVHLRKQMDKPVKKRKYKFPRRKGFKFLSIAGTAASSESYTPTILEIARASYDDLVEIGENVTIERIEENIKKLCGKRLPYSVVLQAVGFFAPHIYRDWKQRGGKAESTLEPELDEPLHPPPQEEEKEEYKMYTDKNRKGIPLTKAEYFGKKEIYENQASKYKFIIDEINYECFFNGQKIEGREKPVKPAWRALIYLLLIEKKPGSTVNYKDVFKFVWPGKKYFIDDTYRTVERWISFFRSYFDDKMQWFIIGQDKREFVFQEIVDFSFCIFRYVKDAPN